MLTNQTEAFVEDTVIAGPIEVDIWVSTTATVADWIVKLIDVRPDGPETALVAGCQMLLRSEVVRGRFRNDYAKPEDFQKATHRVFRSVEHPTSLRFGVLLP